MGEEEESWEEKKKDEGVHCAGFGVSRGCWLPSVYSYKYGGPYTYIVWTLSDWRKFFQGS